MKAKIRVSQAGGSTVEVEFEDGDEIPTVAEIFDALAERGFSLEGAKVSINGETAEEDAVPEDGDLVSATKTPEGA